MYDKLQFCEVDFGKDIFDYCIDGVKVEYGIFEVEKVDVCIINVGIKDFQFDYFEMGNCFGFKLIEI